MMGHRRAWVLLVLCLVTIALAVATRDWTWVIVGALFIISAAGTLWRYYTWPRRIRRP